MGVCKIIFYCEIVPESGDMRDGLVQPSHSILFYSLNFGYDP